MFANIKFHTNIAVPLHYNEVKLTEGKAESIWAENFLKDHDQLSMKDKMARMHQRSSLNEKMVDHGVHISLSFGRIRPVDNNTMKAVASSYMDSMGFRDQPYVVYRHHDAGHAHLHVVATNIRADGSKIRIRPRDLRESLKICRRIEQEFSLERNIKAGPESKAQFEVLQAQKVVHGRPGFKRAVSDVLNTVVDHYQYTSVEELNAVLRLYNVEANPGPGNSRLRAVGGMLYHGLTEDGKKVGVPFKASEFLLHPTLNHLKERFTLNRGLREDSKEHLKTAIEWAFAGEAPGWKEFQEELERQGISVVMPGVRDGPSENVYFVDHLNKAVYASQDLAANYSLNDLRNRCGPEETLSEQETQRQYLHLHL